MNKNFNYCYFVGFLLLSLGYFCFGIESALIISCVVFIISVFAGLFILMFKKRLNSVLCETLYFIISLLMFCGIKYVINHFFPNLISKLDMNFDFILIPVLLMGILVSKFSEDEEDSPMKNVSNLFNMNILNIFAFLLYGFIREFLATGKLFTAEIFDSGIPFFESYVLSFVLVALIFGILGYYNERVERQKYLYKVYFYKSILKIRNGGNVK